MLTIFKVRPFIVGKTRYQSQLVESNVTAISEERKKGKGKKKKKKKKKKEKDSLDLLLGLENFFALSIFLRRESLNVLCENLVIVH